MSECKSKVRRISKRVTEGKTIPVFQCETFGNCVNLSEDRVKTGIEHSCEGCQSFLKMLEPPSYMTCIHRGEPTGEKLSCNCGNDKSIHHCAIFGRCTKRLPVGWNQEKLVELHPGVTVCRDCQSAE